MRVAILIMVLLVCGCGSDQHPYTDVTPDGHRVYIPQSIYEHGLYFSFDIETEHEEIRTTLLEWTDYLVDEWVIDHPERSVEFLLQVANSYVYVIIDDFGFPCKYYGNGLCNGTCNTDDKEIYVAIYGLFYTSILSDGFFPPHTIRTGVEMNEWLQNSLWIESYYYMGHISTTVGLNALPHELDHAIGIDHSY